MANKRYNNQLFKDLKSKGVIGDKIKVKDLKKIERPKKMGGGMMKRKMLKKGTEFGMLSVKAGIDKNPKPTQADRIAGAKINKKNA